MNQFAKLASRVASSSQLCRTFKRSTILRLSASQRTDIPSLRNIRLYSALCSSNCNRSLYELVRPSMLCNCGCGIQGMHTRGDRELVEFLQEEIEAEKKGAKSSGKNPTQLDDFSVSYDAAEIILERKFHDEQITITLNVNHTVDNDAPTQLDSGSQEDVGELRSKPSFEVDVKIGSRVLSFTCTYTHQDDVAEGEQPSEDVYGISEVTVYEGEWSEKAYCVSGDILDGVLYDLLMNLLEERGVGNDFAEKLSNLCTDYEHNMYIKMLEDMQKMVRRK